MIQTAVEWLFNQALTANRNIETGNEIYEFNIGTFKKAKEMASKERTRKQLFIGKVSEIIGFDKTLELLKESNETIK